MRRSLGAAMMTCAFLPLVLVTSGAAQADTSIQLPDGHDQFTTRDGLVVAVDRTGEHATISGSMAASPLSRNAWVSGVTSVHITVPADIKVSGGRIETGYLVGCQVDLGSGAHADGSGDTPPPQPKTDAPAGADNGGNNSDGGGGGGNGGVTAGGYAGGTAGDSRISPYADPSLSVQLKPGKVATKEIEDYTFTGTSGITQYVDHTLSIEGCAGAAEARAYTTVTVDDNVMDDSETLWGQPFSLG
ncbi:MspA family porin [Nocardia pseudovaccinii]|uniref:MspA family porin n=1 Tax=Nocardia pseudovaccinii TaxID=189540 RepID=UPI003D929B5B